MTIGFRNSIWILSRYICEFSISPIES